jgi:phosphonate transport system substrate-binding protein
MAVRIIFAAMKAIHTISIFTCTLLLFIRPLAGQPLRMATYQYASNDRIGNMAPVAQYLQTELGDSISLKSYPTVQRLIEAVQQNEVDIAFINTFGFLLLEGNSKGYPMEPVLRLDVPMAASDNYKSAIVARRSTGIHALSEIKDRAANLRLTLVAPGSTSGNLVPRMAIHAAGIENIEQGFASFAWSGTHAKALETLMHDSADIAAMGLTSWDQLAKSDTASRALRPVWISPEIPLGPVLFNKKIGPEKSLKIQALLKQIHTRNSMALEALKNGWTEAKQATHFVNTDAGYYRSFSNSLGNTQDVNRVIQQFIQ